MHSTFVSRLCRKPVIPRPRSPRIRSVSRPSMASPPVRTAGSGGAAHPRRGLGSSSGVLRKNSDFKVLGTRLPLGRDGLGAREALAGRCVVTYWDEVDGRAEQPVAVADAAHEMTAVSGRFSRRSTSSVPQSGQVGRAMNTFSFGAGWTDMRGSDQHQGLPSRIPTTVVLLGLQRGQAITSSCRGFVATACTMRPCHVSETRSPYGELLRLTSPPVSTHALSAIWTRSRKRRARRPGVGTGCWPTASTAAA